VSALVIGLPSGVTYAQLDQRELAQHILSGDLEQRNTALAKIRTLGPQNASLDVRAAMITALSDEANVHAQRYYSARRGEAPQDLRDAEFVAQLSLAVVELHDPEAIPALSAALFAGPLVSLELANFGERAAASVVKSATVANGWYDSVDGALISLRFMLEQRDEHPLSPTTIAQIRGAVTQRLSGKQYFTTLWRAMDLAAAFGDAGLRHTLELLASDPREVVARGVENPDVIKLTQQRAADRLAGMPALPSRVNVMTTQR
jgi:hypothetical protein